jgi:pimeloyl-ACP methyl ester carboxylesterase
MSYNKDLVGNDITITKMVADTVEVSKYLISKFKVDNIYLMAHSSGTLLGIKAIQQNPELYSAYIGIGQVVNVPVSEQNIYQILLDTAIKANDEPAIAQLKGTDSRMPNFPSINYLLGIKNRLIHKYGMGITRLPYKMSQINKNIFFFSGYTMKEKANFFRGLSFGIKLLPELLTIDLRTEPLIFKIPMYFMHGKFDGQVSLKLAKQYFDMITAPDKAFIEFENSSHSPNYDEQERFVSAIHTVLYGLK